MTGADAPVFGERAWECVLVLRHHHGCEVVMTTKPYGFEVVRGLFRLRREVKEDENGDQVVASTMLALNAIDRAAQ